jgi:hypothetical protein
LKNFLGNDKTNKPELTKETCSIALFKVNSYFGNILDLLPKLIFLNEGYQNFEVLK